MVICGIDPGLTGAIVTIDNKAKTGFIYKLAYGSNKVLNPFNVEAFLKQIRPARIYLEKNHGRNGWASTANYNMGVYWGQVRYAIARLELSCTEVTPAKWQNVMFEGLSGVTAKEKARAAYQSLFPRIIPKGAKGGKAPDGVIDALLICAYGFSKYNKAIGSDVKLTYWGSK